ncbi:MAG: Npt1/Npt2 family nucleotide transporter [Deltaproteobacteria bacterium]|nr:Npt1/Npt2 family nucleotide transporter [Deltaproteobacteria bacterium]
MRKVLGDWLKIYEDEIALFLWVLLLLFLIRTSSILFNNFAETAFLKRFGVEYLPIVQVINSFSTFFIMAFITGLMAKIPGSRMLGYMLLFSGISVALLRFVIPMGFELIYPVLYILKAQYEALLVLLFWNLSNDLFNTRQSKRLFPLITAGGVIGGILGSFATPPLAKLITMDNLMFAYLITTVIGAVVVKMMGTRFPALLVKDPQKKKQGKKKIAFLQEFKDILPLMKQSTLVKILILLTLLPNVAIPIINYQFSYAVNDTFATQGKMLDFFGYFRGAMNIVSLIILLFVGRVYGKWGLPMVLMFHPVNYMIAFAGFLLKFDIFSAMYARVSTNVIRTTMNNPARAVLMGLFPLEYRAIIRPFLRGTVVRIGILAGSGIIIVSEGWFHPRYLSIAAMVFVGGWILTTVWLKKSYSNILLDLITRNIIDLKSLEEKDLGSVFADKTIQSRMIQNFLDARGRDALWHAELLKPQGIPDFDTHLLRVIEQNEDDPTRIELLAMLSPEAGEGALPVLKDLVNPENPALTLAAVQAANRFPPELSKGFAQDIFETQVDPEIKAYAVSSLYQLDPEKYREVIDRWLDSDNPTERRAGVIASGAGKDPAYVSPVRGTSDP